MPIRKHVEQLPNRIQTDTNRKLFASTVDQVFQPGSVETLAGYIGQKPSYYDATSDLYISEPDLLRQTHQLEPAMVSRLQGTATSILTYDDFINYLSINNAITTDHNRLFSDTVYAWAPPADLDKLNNHGQYFWFGDAPSLIPALVLISPVNTSYGDGTQHIFALPSPIQGAVENIAVVVDGVAIDRWSKVDASTISIAVVPAHGSRIDVYRYGDLTTSVAASDTFDATLFNTQTVGMLSSGMRISIRDAGLPRDYWVEGVGSAIMLVPFDSAFHSEAASPVYVTIDRRSKDGNPWSRFNYWIHINSFAWAGVKFPQRAAKRPIVEFIPDIELTNYGSTRIDDITCKVSGNPLFGAGIYARSLNQFISDYDILPFDERGYQSSAILEIPVAKINGNLKGSIYVDAQHVLQIGDKLLVVNNADSSVNNCVLTIDSVIDPSTQLPIFAAIVTHVPQAGDILRVPSQGMIAWDETSEGFDTSPYEYNEQPVEYYFNGLSWVQAQTCRLGGDPLFNVYTAGGDVDTTGNRLFNYAVGTGTNDSVLNRPLQYDSQGEILFSNDLAIPSGSGFRYFRIKNNGSQLNLSNCWMVGKERSIQQKDANGVWNIPLNLSANPDNEQISTLSRPQWYSHISTTIESQQNFIGSVYAANNYRDTMRDPSLGRGIIQNKSPLLKAMLLASDERLDYFTAVRFVEVEYTRFRQQFFQQITVVLQSGQCTVDQLPQVWVDTILANLTSSKTSSFPFALSSVGGGSYFIPPTPAAIGLLPCCVPEIVVDNSYGAPISMIVGHDGSRTPANGDIRDSVMLALELMIYAHIDSRFKSDALLSFELLSCFSGAYRIFDITANYSPADRASLISSSFIRWAQVNNFDYTVNTGYVASDPFTWNYRGCVDRYGTAITTGHWRGVYRYFFDTDQPHVAPWEMLGFASKPTWFDAAYGVAPYTSGNTVLWNDLRDGVIRQGTRKGTDLRFARPDLYSVLPVDESGSLLNPMVCGVVQRAPTVLSAKACWQIGDHGPIENLWMNSPAYGFTKARLGALIRPAEWIEAGWDTTNTVEFNGQRLNGVTQDRARSVQLVVHGEIVDGAQVVQTGIQQWLADCLISQGRSPALLGAAVRGLGVQLAHKMAGFTQTANIRTRADNIGVLPNEDVEVILYEPSPFRTSYYSSIIVEWTGAGWSVVGYDDMKNVFNTIPGDAHGSKTTISLGANPAIYDWFRGVYYPIDRLVEYKGAVYRCVVAHTAGAVFTASNWVAETDLVTYPQVQVCNRGEDNVVAVAYSTVFTTVDDVASFIRDYFRWLENEGWEFSDIDTDTGIVQDWNFAIRQFLEWTQLDYVPGNFIALSPGAEKCKFVAKHGQAYNLQTIVGGSYGLVNRAGQPLSVRSVLVSRDDATTEIKTQTKDLAGARVRLGEIEHIVLFSNTTIFNDLIYQPLFNLRQPRIYFIGSRVLGWSGRREAAGYVISDNQLMPSFVKAEEDVRYMFEIEGSDNATLRKYARHVIGYEARSYLDNLLVDETEQFEFYQGMIQEKGSATAFTKLARSHLIEQNGDIQFLEEWALKLSDYGSVAKSETCSFVLRRQDLRLNPQPIFFGRTRFTDGVIDLDRNDIRWVETPTNAIVFPYVTTVASDGGFGIGPYGITGWDVASGNLTSRGASALPNAGYVRIDEAEYVVFNNGLLSQFYMNGASTFTVAYGTRVWSYDRGDGTFDLLSAFYADNADNAVTSIQTIAEDSTLGTGYARINFKNPHYMGADDVGLNCVLAGLTGTNAEMEGTTKIASVDSTTSLIVASNSTAGYDYTVAGILGYAPPPFFVLRSLRFANNTAAGDFWKRFNPTSNQLIYVDDSGNGTSSWIVYRWDDLQQSWVTYREQPPKLDSTRVARTLIYDSVTRSSGNQLIANPVLLEGLTVLDPNAGLLPGEALRELAFMLDYDPAIYTQQETAWGALQVGQLWWDLSTVRFLTTETDVVYKYDDPVREQRELQYRIDNWAGSAPASSFDVYEWTRSLDEPASYSSTGTVRNSSDPSFVTRVEFDSTLGSLVTAYYFWVAGQTVVPAIDGRNISALAVATTLANPRTNDLSWVAPIAPNAMLICNVEQFVADETAVFEVAVQDNAITGLQHSEWQIVRKQDGETTPPEAHWKALRSSLTGFDDLEHPLPASALPVVRSVGYGSGKTMFKNGRAGMLLARKTFVETINQLLGRTPLAFDNPTIAELITAVTPSFSNLTWQCQDSRMSRVLAPINSYTAAVVGLEERDALLRGVLYRYIRGFEPWDITTWDTAGWDADFTHKVSQETSARILVNNPNGDKPSWTVWEIDPTTSLTSDNPDDWLKLAHNYSYSVATYADMIAATYPVLGRVLVESDENADGFWTVWIYNPDNRYANANGFILLNAQTYRTTDFWSLVDWYATGYSALSSPVVSYQDAAARNAAEGPSPANLTVLIKDDGRGSWAWTNFDGTSWNYVARQNGTVALSAAFYDQSRVLYGVGTPILSDVVRRDGSLEMQMLVDLLRTQVLSDGELNEVWFSMLHFMHSQQDMIDWAFKTSYLSLAGLNETLTQTGISTVDVTENLLDYVEEIKPYRVKTRDYTRTLSPPVESVNTYATDFDSPAYYDSMLKAWRRLDPKNITDIGIFQAQKPWKDWFNAYTNVGSDPLLLGYNPVRKLHINMRFDRIDPTVAPLHLISDTSITGMAAVPGLESASNRMLAFYKPTEGMIASGEAILGVEDKREQITGGSGQVDLNLIDTGAEQTISVNTLGSNDLRYLAGHPEELLPVVCNDGVSLTVSQRKTVGASHQKECFSKRKAASIRIAVGIVPASLESVFVFFDGVRAATSAYTVSYSDQSVTVTPPTPRPKTIMVHVLGVGGLTMVTEQTCFDGDGTINVFHLLAIPNGSVDVNVDGHVVDPQLYSLTGNAVTFVTAPPSGSSLLICARGLSATGSSDTQTVAVRQLLPYSVSQTWTLNTPTHISYGPQHVGTIVEVNGMRLNHPFTRYSKFDANRRSAPYTAVGDVGKLKVWVDKVPYTGIIGQVPNTQGSVVPVGYIGKWDTAGWDDEMLWDVEGDIVSYDSDRIVANNPSLSGQIIVASYENNDFDVIGNSLLITKSVLSTDIVEATTYKNADLLDIQTSSFNGSNDGLYQIPRTQGETCLVTVNGLAQTAGVDYDIRLMTLGYDEVANDEDIYEMAPPDRYVVMNRALPDKAFLNVMAFTGRLSSDDFIWHSSSLLPSAQMIGEQVRNQQGTVVTATSSLGTRSVYEMKDTWDFNYWDAVNVGLLNAPLEASTTSFSVQLNPDGLSARLVDVEAFTIPDSESTGAVWIDGERVEYQTVAISDSTATFFGLRRGTNATAIGTEQRVTQLFNGDGLTHSFKLSNARIVSDIASSIEVSLHSGGQMMALSMGVHYSVAVDVTDVVVTLLVAPTVMQTLSLGQTSGIFHQQGCRVYPARISQGHGPFDKSRNIGA